MGIITRLSLFLSLFICLLSARTAKAGQPAYYDNPEGWKIAACVRDQIQHAPAPSMDSLRFGHEWVCKQLMFLWNAENHLNILIERNDFGRPFFKFQETGDTKSASIFENETPIAGDDKKVYGYFSFDFQTGFFSHGSYGPPPHRQDYLTFNKDGYLLWEESTANKPFNKEFFPALYEQPIALYWDYPGITEDLKYRVTTYGVCYDPTVLSAAKAPCF